VNRPSTVFLVVEDEPSDAEFLLNAFLRAGGGDRVYTVENGQAAVAYLTNQSHSDPERYPIPDVIITDLKTPHMNGLELLEWLHGHEIWRRIPRIVLTSSTAGSDVATAYAFGAAAFLVKPVEIHELRAMAKAISDFWRHSLRPIIPRDDGKP
jgi:CheY-like chemotaxis protein